MSKQLNNVLFIFKMVMSCFYVAIGLTFLFRSGGIAEVIPAQYTPILGVLLIVYGLFRGYRAYFVERKMLK
jgi:hypothetical protein